MRHRLTRHLLAQIVCLGTHSITSLLSASGRLDEDWTSDYRMYSRRRIDPDALFASVRTNMLSAFTDPLLPAVVALDDTRIRKCGRKVSGVKYTRDPLSPPFHVNLIRAQRFLQLSLATSDDAEARMIPVAWRHAPSPHKPSANAPAEEQREFRAACLRQSLASAAAAELQRMRSWMDEHGQQQRPLWTIVDGGYTNGRVLKNLPPRTVLVGRIRADAKLYFLPSAEEALKGRPRVYGAQAPTPEQLRQNPAVPWQELSVSIGGEVRDVRVKSLGPLRWRSAGGGLVLKLVVIAPVRYRISPAGKYLYRKPAFLISTDPNAGTEEIVRRYIHRWDIEVNFRDEKTLLGVGEAQVRNSNSVEKVTGTAVAAYALMLAAARNLSPTTDLAIPRPKWQRHPPSRITTRQLIQQMRYELWGQAMTFSGFVSKTDQTRSPENDLSNPFYAVMQASRHS